MLSKQKILAIVGSNNKQSFTNILIKELFNEIGTLDQRYETKVICLRDYRIDYCIGCKTCFYEGFCPVDRDDDFPIIRNELLDSEIIFFASPVYMHNIPGVMKTFFDRISASTHLLNYAGKMGFTLTTTSRNGQDDVKKYLIKMQEAVGIKNLDNYIFSNKDNIIEQFIETNTVKFFQYLENNYGHTNKILEGQFGILRNFYYSTIDHDLGKNQQKTFELDYWNQTWIKECRSFQEFAVKNRKIRS